MKSIQKESNLLILHCISSGGSLRTTIPYDFVKQKKLRDRDVLVIDKSNVKIGKYKLELGE